MLHVLIETAACTKLKQEGRLHNVTVSKIYSTNKKHLKMEHGERKIYTVSVVRNIDSRSQMYERGISLGKQHQNSI